VESGIVYPSTPEVKPGVFLAAAIWVASGVATSVLGVGKNSGTPYA